MQEQNKEELKEINKVVWYGGHTLPSNEPVCGFRGLKYACIPVGKVSVLVMDTSVIKAFIYSICHDNFKGQNSISFFLTANNPWGLEIFIAICILLSVILATTYWRRNW
jgi:hypothetical protein